MHLQKEEIRMRPMRKALVAAALVGSTVTGGAVGAYVFGPSLANAQSATTTTPAASNSQSGTGSAAPARGTFRPNEDPAHEAQESAQREAQENAGQFPTVP
jgi:hypothetical protein